MGEVLRPQAAQQLPRTVDGGDRPPRSGRRGSMRWQVPGRVDAEQIGIIHYRAHRPGIYPAIGMAADSGVYGNDRIACAAADAAEHVAEFAAQHS